MSGTWTGSADATGGVWHGCDLIAMGMVLGRWGSFSADVAHVDTAVTYAVSYADPGCRGQFAGRAVLTWLANLLVIAVLFGLIFKVLPDVKIAWRGRGRRRLCHRVTVPAGPVSHRPVSGAGQCWVRLRAAGHWWRCLVWVYYSSQILFFGAEFTQFGPRTADRRLFLTATRNGPAPVERRHEQR